MALRCAPSSRWRRKFSVSAQMSELSGKTVSLKAAGRLFQMAAAETAKSLAPMTVLDRRANSFVVSADRRCRWPAAAEARTQSSASYDGARPCRHLKTIMTSLNSIRLPEKSAVWAQLSWRVSWTQKSHLT